MSKAIYPISRLLPRAALALPLEIANALEDEFGHTDDFTYTIRYTVPEDKRDEVRQRVRKVLSSEPNVAEQFLAIMDSMDWDVSFLVDTY